MEYTSEFYRLDELERNNCKLLQDTREFCFGMDSVLLADYAVGSIKNNSHIMELCCGNGAVSVLMLARNSMLDITGVEINENSAALGVHNSKINGFEEKFRVENCDLRELPKAYSNMFDAVVVNPPYYLPECGIQSTNSNKISARSEADVAFLDVIVCAKRVLKDKGKLIMVHRPNRLGEIVNMLESNLFALKQIRFVYPKKGTRANAMLINATKNGGHFTDVLTPLIVYDEQGNYTNDIMKIYYG